MYSSYREDIKCICEQNENLQFPDGTGFYPDVQDGQRGYNTDPARGADTFFPFSGTERIVAFGGNVQVCNHNSTITNSIVAIYNENDSIGIASNKITIKKSVKKMKLILRCSHHQNGSYNTIYWYYVKGTNQVQIAAISNNSGSAWSSGNTYTINLENLAKGDTINFRFKNGHTEDNGCQCTISGCLIID